MIFKKFLSILSARNKEFLRDRSALAWNILFPALIVAGFAFAFSGEGQDQYKVALYQAEAAQQGESGFLHTKFIQFIPVTDLERAKRKLEHHQFDMLLDLGARVYWVNASSPNGYILERVLQGSSPGEFAKQAVEGRPIRYVDWLLPGVLAMNMMFSALFGVGYVIVRYRKNGVLKRFKATPLTAFEFLAAQVISRLWIIMAITIFVYLGTDLFIDFTMNGSYLNLLLVFTLGATCLIALALLSAMRIASEELAGGILNLLSWPMMFLSGVWFSTGGIHPWLQQLALLLPLTHVIDAARAIMVDGAGLAEISSSLMVLLGMTALFLAIGARFFKWE
ncbi:MAG: ABC transporter permease [Pseudomonadota bacterium]